MPYYFTISADGTELETLCVGYDAFNLFDALLSIKPIWDRESQLSFPEYPPTGISKEQAQQFRKAEAAANGVTTISFDELRKSRSGTIGSLLMGFIEKMMASLRRPKSYDWTPNENIDIPKADLELLRKVRPRMSPGQVAAIRQYDRDVERIVRESCSPLPDRVPHYKFEAFDGWHVSATESQIIASELTRLLDLPDGDLVSKLAATEAAQSLFPNWEVRQVETPSDSSSSESVPISNSIASSSPPMLDSSDCEWIREDAQKWRDFHSRAANSGYSIS